ncbi:type II secretion system F family protein [Wenzhouxiangella sp. AB-CW3]|uniref:type II secretion system F family protein n=1 Tax=Wenzhouxiangella sp. AB-CW3 TaxID=2771012 RepID=UPI00168BAEB8|nr:type II secretion system F family protein [Wenzhouxiangella sp. AB-CW3]QOC22173.1 type II secretion system F family protein [Wenzhouxiangella sp. AB-CW3]
MSRLNTYYYRILKPDGGVRTGFYRLAVERDFSARVRLEREQDAVVLSLWRLPQVFTGIHAFVRGLFQSDIRPEELAGFLRDLGVMLRAGIPALDALSTLIGEGDTAGSRRVARVASSMLEDLDAGVSVSEAFERRPDVFPETVRNLIRIGDQSGNLDRMLLESASHVERMINVRRDVRTALIYPVVVFASIFAVALFWIYYVLPAMQDLFLQLNAELPALTVTVMNLAGASGDHVWTSLIVVVMTVLGLYWLFRHHEPSRYVLHRTLHRLPVSRVIVTSAGMAQLTEHLGILVRGGLDMVSSLDVLGRSTSDLYYRRRLQEVRESVMRGESVARSMRVAGGFPAMAVRMIGVGEESGSLDEQLTHLADEYRRRLEVVVRSLAEIIKPAVILVAGALFIFLVIALLIPVYDLIQQSVTQGMGGA